MPIRGARRTNVCADGVGGTGKHEGIHPCLFMHGEGRQPFEAFRDPHRIMDVAVRCQPLREQGACLRAIALLHRDDAEPAVDAGKL